jgi:transglutaminase-like putative cysteine protease
MGTDVFFHGYAELFIGQRWVKATPAHNLAMCERFGIIPVEFDGTSDAVFHPLDRQGRRHTEYLRYHGTFADLPYEQIIGICRQYYPNWFGEKGA